MTSEADETSAHEPLSNPAHLAASIRAKASKAEKIYSISLLCHPRTPTSVTCMISVAPDYANALSAECGGQVYGFTMVIATVDVPADFSCMRRPQIPDNCSCMLPNVCPEPSGLK